ncbi:MAG TPA: copper chaperone PCu(A)C [Jatrophihabitans sp.]|nr:copper chaperone PCu(A)C [Jatrophihabitans sp.]
MHGIRLTAAVIAVAATALAGCSSGGTSQHASAPAPSSSALAGTGHASVGALSIYDAYIPQPASPDVAAAYLVVHNGSAMPDKLLKVASTSARSVMTMTESDSGTTGAMSMLTDITIPPDGDYVFSPGHAHVMFEHPTATLKQGQSVMLTLTFQHAGAVRLTVPVVPITGPGGSLPSMGTTGSGAATMPGMGG